MWTSFFSVWQFTIHGSAARPSRPWSGRVWRFTIHGLEGLAASSGLAVHYTWISVMYSEIPNLSTYEAETALFALTFNFNVCGTVYYMQ